MVTIPGIRMGRQVVLLCENGKAVKNGWKTIDDAEYYFLKSGTMPTGCKYSGRRTCRRQDGKRDAKKGQMVNYPPLNLTA